MDTNRKKGTVTLTYEELAKYVLSFYTRTLIETGIYNELSKDSQSRIILSSGRGPREALTKDISRMDEETFETLLKAVEHSEEISLKLAKSYMKEDLIKSVGGTAVKDDEPIEYSSNASDGTTQKTSTEDINSASKIIDDLFKNI